MLAPKVIVDSSLFEKKMGALGTKVIPYARIQAEQIAKYGVRAVELFTLRGATQETPGRGSRGRRTSGRRKIAELWRLTHKRKAYMDIYTIKNLYPNQDVIVIFEEGAQPHEIRPKQKKVLHWVDEETGQKIFAPSVQHPGMEATHMMARTEQTIQPKIDLWLSKTFKMVDKEMR